MVCVPSASVNAVEVAVVTENVESTPIVKDAKSLALELKSADKDEPESKTQPSEASEAVQAETESETSGAVVSAGVDGVETLEDEDDELPPPPPPPAPNPGLTGTGIGS